MSRALQSCPLCAGHSLTELCMANDRHYGIAGLYRLDRCLACSLVFLNPMYSDAELSGLYPSDYYAYQDQFRTNRWKQWLKRILGYYVGTRDPHFESPGNLLDLGCGSGWFMHIMRERGWNCFGVEISESASALGRQSKNLQIFSGTLQQASYPSGFFDFIRANHSFEHISCPNETLTELHRILKSQGKLLIAVPNIGSLNARLFNKYWWHLCPPVHTFSYSV